MKHGKNGKIREQRRSKRKPRTKAPQSGKDRRVISATEAACSFSELLDRVCYRGETFVIERGGEAACEMSHVKPLRFSGADFLTLLQSLPKPYPRYWNTLENSTKQAPAVPQSP